MLAVGISRVAELFAVNSGMVEQLVDNDVAVGKGGCNDGFFLGEGKMIELLQDPNLPFFGEWPLLFFQQLDPSFSTVPLCT